MNTRILEDNGIDYAGGLHRFCGNESIYEHYLASFLSNMFYKDLVRLFSEGADNEALYRAAHGFKGVCANLGINELAVKSAELIALIRENADHEKIACGVKAISEDYALACKIIEQALIS